MNSEEWRMRRLLCIAQMAATLESGDRAHGRIDWIDTAAGYANRATKLFDAVDKSEAEIAEAVDVHQ